MTPALDHYLTNIAVRNRAWCRWQDAREVWIAAGKPTGELLGVVNDRQHEYEWAARDVARARVWLRHDDALRAGGAPIAA